MATIQLGVINDIGIIRIAPFTAVELKCLASAVNADNSAALADAATESANAAAATALSYVGTSPTGAYANLAALQAAYPTGEDGVFVVKDTGYWYFWNGSAWEDGGEYQKDIPTTTIEELRMSDLRQMSAIKEVENTLNSININQETTNTASGYGTISLPKNAANGGMSVKMEGLTQDVGGVITHFEPTGRVRSDIGGRNLLLKTSTLELFDPAGNVSIANGILTSVNTGTSGNRDYIVVWSFTVVPNTDYVMSIAAKTNNQSSVKIWTNLYTETFAVTTEWKRYSIKFNSGNNTTINLSFNNASAVANAYYLSLKEPKLEIGNKATDYTPAPEDVLAGTVKGTGTSLYLTAPELRSNGLVKDEIRKGANGYELVKRISSVDGTVLATPVISPISYGGVLNSAENGTVYHEPIIADAGVYGTNMPILLTDYPIASIEEIIKHEGGGDTYLNASTAVIAPDGLSFTHPDLASGDLVLFTYAFDKESTNGNITATFYDSNVVKIDTETGKAYKIEDVITNGVLTRILTEV